MDFSNTMRNDTHSGEHWSHSSVTVADIYFCLQHVMQHIGVSIHVHIDGSLVITS